MNYELTSAYISFLTGSPETVMDWRVINDRDKGSHGRNIRGTLAQCYNELAEYNAAHWGVFVCINQLDGVGHHLNNVAAVRAHVVDLDNPMTAQDSYNRALNSNLPPHMAVQSSSGKYHLYWLMQPYNHNEFYTEQQRKFIQLYQSDPTIIDATRVLRVPGFNHCKAEPIQTTCWQLSQNPHYSWEQIKQHLDYVNIINIHGDRHELGDTKLAAPSLEWLVYALNLLDPNDFSYVEWMATSAAFKQAGWTLVSEDILIKHWIDWCSRYQGNDINENLKVWGSFRDTQVGWKRFERITNVKAYMMYGDKPREEVAPVIHANPAAAVAQSAAATDDRNNLPEILDCYHKKIWFKDCYFVASTGKIFSPSGRWMNSTQFNGLYGGKEFTLRPAGGKTTDEAWKAALRATDWTIEKVDHTRFLPENKPYSITEDGLGRKGLNTYIPAHIKAVQGDVNKWDDFLHRILPTHGDVIIFNNYLAHCIKYPGKKIPWAVVLQSERGIGKMMIAQVFKRCLGDMYTYQPKAEELVSGGNRFNSWMKNKLGIIVDEIRVGDRHNLLENLKVIITDDRIAVERKGEDQEMEDNCANWLFFSNYKDAIPVDGNERRYSVFYSSLQSAKAIEIAGMDKDYFDSMYNWLENGGYEAIAYFYMNYQIEKGGLPHRAPETSSYTEVLRVSRSPLEVLLDEKLQEGSRGFRGGYISWPMFIKAIETDKRVRFTPAEHKLEAILENKGYHKIGYCPNLIPAEDMSRPPLLFAVDPAFSVNNYEASQI